MPQSEYDARTYWASVLNRSFNLQGVGWPDLSLAFNRWQYRARRDAIRRLVPHARGLRVLDVGPGVGYWVALWQMLGAAEVCGVDLTATSVEHLRAHFPEYRFAQGDIRERLPFEGTFDLISAIDVLLHITDDARYGSALANLRQVSRPGTRLLLLEPLAQSLPIPFTPGQTSRARSLAWVRRLLAQTGWAVQAVQPANWLYSNPVETDPATLCRALNIYWSRLQPLVRDEVAGHVVGAALFPVDRLLSRLPWGPTSRTLLAEAR